MPEVYVSREVDVLELEQCVINGDMGNVMSYSKLRENISVYDAFRGDVIINYLIVM